MSQWLVVVTGGIYAVIAWEQYTKGNLPVAAMFAGYAFANVGIFFQTS